MKYKLTAMFVCAAVIVGSITAQCYTQAKEKMIYHQHREEMHNEERDTGYGFSSHLPIVAIDTHGADIPGAAITNDDGEVFGYTTTPEGEDRIICNVHVMDTPHSELSPEKKHSFESQAFIHVRGNSSRTFDKLGYALRLVTENGENNPQAMMGMAKHHEWVLHGPFLDKTLMRNYMWYNIASEIMDYAPGVRFCEVVLNDKYMGLYVMVEAITAGDQNSRLYMSKASKNINALGYIVQLDRGAHIESKNITPFSCYSLQNEQKMHIVYPGKTNLTPTLSRQICQEFSDFEKALYSYDYDGNTYGYNRYIDADSFADYVIINEFTSNYDAGKYSTFVYKEVNSKYRMCIWDFNLACDNYGLPSTMNQTFSFHKRPWFYMLMKDGGFTDRVIARYREHRQTYLSEEYLYQYIDDTVAYLGEAVERNYALWGYTFDEKYDQLSPKERNPRNYQAAIDQMKAFIHIRGTWLDENIEALKSYSAESSVKKYNDNAN